jgi:hypothetical protein
VIARDAVDGDGHLLVVFVDGDVDLGLCGVADEQHQPGNGNEEGTHFTLGLQAFFQGVQGASTRKRLDCSTGSPSPGVQYARNPARVPVACDPIVNPAR